MADVKASSEIDAIKIAKELISVVRSQHSEYAILQGVLLVCGYGPGEIVAVTPALK